MIDYQQIERNRAMVGLPVAVSEGRYTGTFTATSYGPSFNYFGGDGKVRRLAPITRTMRVRKPYTRVNGPVRITRSV